MEKHIHAKHNNDIIWLLKKPGFWAAIVVAILLIIAVATTPKTDTTNTASTPLAETSESQTAEEAKEPVTLTLSGIGQTASDTFSLTKGLATFKLKHDGNSNFSIVLMDYKGNYISSLVNEIGTFDGSKATKINEDGKYLLDISADGNWSVKITQ